VAEFKMVDCGAGASVRVEELRIQYNLVYSGLNSIPKDYYDAASMTVPAVSNVYKYNASALVPTIFFVFIISIINSFKVFREAYLLCGNYPPLNMYMLQHFMNNNFNNLNYQRLSTASLLMELFIVAIVFLMYKIEGRYGKSF